MRAIEGPTKDSKRQTAHTVWHPQCALCFRQASGISGSALSCSPRVLCRTVRNARALRPGMGNHGVATRGQLGQWTRNWPNRRLNPLEIGRQEKQVRARTGEETIAIRSVQRAIRLSNDERAAAVARVANNRALGADDPNAAMLDPPSGAGSRFADA